VTRSHWTLFVATSAFALVACSGLPEYAAPKGRVVGDPASLDTSDVIRYRTLVRADFKSQRPPTDFAPHVDRIGAATCAHILTTPDTQMAIRGVPAQDGGKLYRATPHHVRFFAQMDRNCSWWNPKDVGLPSDYILEHEQIHFALFELEARRLNAALPELSARLEATAATPDAAAQALQRQFQDQIQRRLSAILARSREFDEDTSMGHEPEEQKRWWRLVQSELAAVGE
jgi:hypothetical protein